MVETDENLVARAARGDLDALSELLSRIGPAIEQGLQIGRKWRTLIEPADVMQVTYLEAFAQIKGFDPQRAAAFPVWLRQIAENNLRDAIRGLERQKQPPVERRIENSAHADSSATLFEILAVATTTPSRAVGLNELRQLMDAALEQLPTDYAAVVRMYDLEGRPISEVTEALGRSAGAVHMLRARAHDRLRISFGSASIFFSASA